MKSKTQDSAAKPALYQFRLYIVIFVLAGLIVPFILQQTFYPFFRFGMFAEPVKREIQQERFILAGIQKKGEVEEDLSLLSGIQKSNMDYLLRNYYYRQEADVFLEKVSTLLPNDSKMDTLIIFRIMPSDTSIVARYPTWKGQN